MRTMCRLRVHQDDHHRVRAEVAGERRELALDAPGLATTSTPPCVRDPQPSVPSSSHPQPGTVAGRCPISGGTANVCLAHARTLSELRALARRNAHDAAASIQAPRRRASRCR